MTRQLVSIQNYLQVIDSYIQTNYVYQTMSIHISDLCINKKDKITQQQSKKMASISNRLQSCSIPTYSKQAPISQKLNPLLKKVRDNHINCLKQLKQMRNHQNCIMNEEEELDLDDVLTLNTMPIFTHQNVQSKQKQQDSEGRQGCQIVHPGASPKGFHKTGFGHSKKYSMQLGGIESRMKKITMNRTHDQRKPHTTDVHGRHKSYIRSPATADKFKFSTIDQTDPKVKTADYRMPKAQNVQQGFDKGDDLVYDMSQLKMFIRMPHFTVSKTSKIKRHLIEDINLQQIEEKFFKQKQTLSKYEIFCEELAKRNESFQSGTKGNVFKRFKQSSIKNNLIKSIFKADLTLQTCDQGLHSSRQSQKQKTSNLYSHNRSQSLKVKLNIPPHNIKQEMINPENCFVSTRKKFYQKQTPKPAYISLVSRKSPQRNLSANVFVNQIEGKQLLIKRKAHKL